MENSTIYIIFSVLIVSLMSVVSILPLLFKKKMPRSALLALLSLSAGTLLGGVFLHFLPEIAEDGGYTISAGLFVLFGFMVFFLLEKLVHWHHNHGKLSEVDKGAHSHAYHLAPMNLIGDGIHNFLDGMVIAGSYLAGAPLGLAATITVIFHELPQEISDFGVLLYAGMERMKAVLFNFMSALAAFIGAFVAIMLAGATEAFSGFIIPFAAGNFIYIAASNLVPELHLHCKLRDTILHILMMLIGIGLMVAVKVFGVEGQ